MGMGMGMGVGGIDSCLFWYLSVKTVYSTLKQPLQEHYGVIFVRISTSVAVSALKSSDLQCAVLRGGPG